jgi:hypothetical protein
MAFGCVTSRRSAIRSDLSATINTEVDTRTEQSRHTEAGAVSWGEASCDETTDEQVVHREYDASQPTDSLTGHPPLRSETVTRRTSNRRTDRRGATGSVTNEDATTAMVDKSRQSEKRDISLRAKERRTRRIPWMAILIPAAAIGAGYLITKRIRKKMPV